MTASPQPISLHPPFKVPSPLRSSGWCLLTSRGFQVASQSFKKLCLTTFTMACVKRRPEFGFWFGKREKSEVQSPCSRALELALQEATPGIFRKAVPKDPCKAWRPGRTYSSIVLASYQTTTLGSKVYCVFKRWVLFVERIKYLLNVWQIKPWFK